MFSAAVKQHARAAVDHQLEYLWVSDVVHVRCIHCMYRCEHYVQCECGVYEACMRCVCGVYAVCMRCMHVCMCATAPLTQGGQPTVSTMLGTFPRPCVLCETAVPGLKRKSPGLEREVIRKASRSCLASLCDVNTVHLP